MPTKAQALLASALVGREKALTPRRAISDHEHQEQCALFDWAALQLKAIPELLNLSASANGGKRNITVAAKLKKSGVKAGYPDVSLDVARADYHGLRIEMKYGDNTCTALQKDWIRRLTLEGYLCYVAYSWTVAKDLILAYLRGEPRAGLIHKEG